MKQRLKLPKIKHKFLLKFGSRLSGQVLSVFFKTTYKPYNNVIEYIKWTLTDGFSLLAVMQLYLKSVKSCFRVV